MIFEIAGFSNAVYIKCTRVRVRTSVRDLNAKCTFADVPEHRVQFEMYVDETLKKKKNTIISRYF